MRGEGSSAGLETKDIVSISKQKEQKELDYPQVIGKPFGKMG
jgi:hypothetical protein